MNKLTSLVAIIVIAVVGFLVYAVVGKDNNIANNFPPPPSSPKEEIDTSNWKTYQSNIFGFKFNYPDDGPEISLIQPKDSSFPVIDQGLNDDVYIKVYPLGIDTVHDKKFYESVFSEIKNYIHGQKCKDIFIPIYGPDALNDSCKIFISDNGVKIITGFYSNIHGESPFVGFFKTKDYEVILIQFYSSEFVEIMRNDSSVERYAGDDFVARIQRGEFPKITSKLQGFFEILKTVKFL